MKQNDKSRKVKAGIDTNQSNGCSFNCPLFLVSKKSGEKRVVIDLRKINSLIQPLIVSFPRIDTTLGKNYDKKNIIPDKL